MKSLSFNEEGEDKNLKRPFELNIIFIKPKITTHNKKFDRKIYFIEHLDLGIIRSAVDILSNFKQAHLEFSLAKVTFFFKKEGNDYD